ncbi:tRNA (adenosine(37)-N6)-threonylcarbamoyltransferase complex ATPase subunit type 1 TsaE [Candidatus Saccharibacteria bacterium TM7i]|nr:tRNA (adenosine(37)-N6)-threonylcarbamoyltransferase complex ATPase subunit type 1 TsaE [Candidatus Saccharibacteria bacterium TM7i]
MIIEVKSEAEMKALAEKIGTQLKGGEVFELIGDIGAGKTTFTKGLARGLAIDDDVQSPSFTISRMYEARDGLQLAHYDFYRLDDPGIMTNELAEFANDATTVTVVEWADVVEGVLPKDRMRIRITTPTETSRTVEITGFANEERL